MDEVERSGWDAVADVVLESLDAWGRGEMVHVEIDRLHSSIELLGDDPCDGSVACTDLE